MPQQLGLDLFGENSQNDSQNNKPQQMSLNLNFGTEKKLEQPYVPPKSHYVPKATSEAFEEMGYGEKQSDTRIRTVNGVRVRQKYIMNKGWVTVDES